MKKPMLISFMAALSAIGTAKADPVSLSTYVDANGFLDVQELTCGQLSTVGYLRLSSQPCVVLSGLLIGLWLFCAPKRLAPTRRLGASLTAVGAHFGNIRSWSVSTDA